jgi:hypothetical protein
VVETSGASGAGADPGAVLIDQMVEIRQRMARLESQLLTTMDTLARLRAASDPPTGGRTGPDEFVVDEIALALVSTRGRVAEQLRFARALATRLPATRDLLAEGLIDGYQAWLIWDSISRLVDPANVPVVEAAILGEAPALTGPLLRRRLARLITDAEPEAFTERHKRAMRNRCVRVNTTDPENGLDAMGSLCLRHGAVDIAAIDARLTRLARNSRSTGDRRSFDNLRADLVRDLLLGHTVTAGSGGHGDGKRRGHQPDAVMRRSEPADHTYSTAHRSSIAPRPGNTTGSHNSSTTPGPDSGTSGETEPVVAAQVVVAVPIQTLMGVDNSPGELVGYGPIPAPVARKIAADPDGTWRRMLTDPAGNLLDLSTRRYRPSGVLDLAVTVRDQTSRFPRSIAPAVRGDFDHTVPHPTGPTSYRNGGKLSRRDHRLKHAPGWHVTQPHPGTFTWTTPTGHDYTTRAAPQPCGSWPEPWQLDPHPDHALDVIDLPAPPDTG